LNNSEVAKKMGENGTIRAEELSRENITRRITAMYQSAVDKKG